MDENEKSPAEKYAFPTEKMLQDEEKRAQNMKRTEDGDVVLADDAEEEKS